MLAKKIGGRGARSAEQSACAYLQQGSLDCVKADVPRPGTAQAGSLVHSGGCTVFVSPVAVQAMPAHSSARQACPPGKEEAGFSWLSENLATLSSAPTLVLTSCAREKNVGGFPTEASAGPAELLVAC